MNDKVLARVGEREITEQELQALIASLGPQMAMQFSNPEAQERILEEMVNQELIYQDAAAEKLDETEGFKRELELVKESLLKQYALFKLVEDIAVTDEDSVEYYEKHKETMFVEPETISASHILVDTEEEAKEIAKEIEEGLGFEDAAAKYSNCPSKAQGGSLGEFGKGMMVPEFEVAAFELDLDTVSEPVKTVHGFHLILVTEKSESGYVPFEEVDEFIKEQLLSVKQQEAITEKAASLKEKFKVEIL